MVFNDVFCAVDLSLKRCALGPSLAAGALVLAVVSPCWAQTADCDSLSLPHPIYGNGGSAVTADLAKVAVALANLVSPITILYSDATGACTQFQAFLDNNVKQSFHYWKADGTMVDCAPPLAGHTTDFAHMGNPAESCPNV